MDTCTICSTNHSKHQWYRSNPITDQPDTLCLRCWSRLNRTTIREAVNVKKRERYRKNREKILEQNAASTKRHHDRLVNWRRDYEKTRRQNDPSHRLVRYMRTRLWHALKGKDKSRKTLELLGISIEDFKIHLEANFYGNMSWDNYGSHWHIDHIRPISSFDLTDGIQLAEACHYTNLQPLLARDNLKKNATWAY